MVADAKHRAKAASVRFGIDKTDELTLLGEPIDPQVFPQFAIEFKLE
jgi:hypothetical protein